jgi:hypothetical protein
MKAIVYSVIRFSLLGAEALADGATRKAGAVLLAAIGFASVAASGQGQFFFDTHVLALGNDVHFVMPDGSPASGPDLFVEVLAGRNTDTLMPLLPLLALDRKGASAGYTDPLWGQPTRSPVRRNQLLWLLGTVHLKGQHGSRRASDHRFNSLQLR